MTRPLISRTPAAPAARVMRAAPAVRVIPAAPGRAARLVHGRTARLAAVLSLAGALLLAVPAGAGAAPADGGAKPKSEQPSTQADFDNEAALVAAEDHRLDQVRAVVAVAALKGKRWTQPYRLDTGSGYTLVLTQRSTPYGVADLIRLAPQTFVRRHDGSYLLTENIYVDTGAKLDLSSPGGLNLLLASDNRGFVSIVSFGGRLTLRGTPQAPMRIGSWDIRTNKPDTDVRDGRAYVRAVGGQFTMTYARVNDLGFWSGRTGGISLTGTDRPDTSNVQGPDPTGASSDSDTDSDSSSGSSSGSGSGANSGSGSGSGSGSASGTKKGSGGKSGGTSGSGAKSGSGTGALPGSDDGDQLRNGGVTAEPAGPLTTPDSRFAVPTLSYVSAEITDSVISGDLYGLFVSGSTGVTISRTQVRNSLQDGLVMHRGVVNAVIDRTVSQDNGGDGFVLARATEEVRITGSKALSNAGNGFTLSGRPLADGPSASGQPTSSYGSNSVSDGVAKGNGRYGVEISGGSDVGVQNNDIDGGDMGIVARDGATKVSITGNHLTGQKRQGISVRDGVTAATVTGNIVEGADTGVYVRDSQAEVRGNTVQDVTNHGISLVGDVAKSTVSYNVVAGVGPSAVDTNRAHGHLTVKENQTYAWHDTSAFWVKFRHYATPMTLLWASLLLLILISALLGARRSSRWGHRVIGTHPYADKAPLPRTVTEVTPVREQGPRVPAMTE